MSHQVYVGFGSNLGNRLQYFQDTFKHLQTVNGFEALTTSKLVESEPLLKNKTSTKEVPWYLNAIFGFQTQLPLLQVFRILREIEKNSGRLAGKGTWQPRTVDLDLLFYGEVIYEDDQLKVPHPGVANRRFVLMPLAEMNPQFRHPELQMTIFELLQGVNDPLQVLPFPDSSDRRERLRPCSS